MAESVVCLGMILVTYQTNELNKVGSVIAHRFYVAINGDITCYDEDNNEFVVIKDASIYRVAVSDETECCHHNP